MLHLTFVLTITLLASKTIAIPRPQPSAQDTIYPHTLSLQPRQKPPNAGYPAGFTAEICPYLPPPHHRPNNNNNNNRKLLDINTNTTNSSFPLSPSPPLSIPSTNTSPPNSPSTLIPRTDLSAVCRLILHQSLTLHTYDPISSYIFTQGRFLIPGRRYVLNFAFNVAITSVSAYVRENGGGVRLWRTWEAAIAGGGAAGGGGGWVAAGWGGGGVGQGAVGEERGGVDFAVEAVDFVFFAVRFFGLGQGIGVGGEVALYQINRG